MSPKQKAVLAREHLERAQSGVAVYEGDEPDLGESSLEDLLSEVESAVATAEEALP